MFLRISPAGDITVEQPAAGRDEAIAAALNSRSLAAHRISDGLTLVIGADRRWGDNRLASALLARAGVRRHAVTGPAVLLSCDGPHILDRVTDEALDALHDADVASSPREQEAPGI